MEKSTVAAIVAAVALVAFLIGEIIGFQMGSPDYVGRSFEQAPVVIEIHNDSGYPVTSLPETPHVTTTVPYAEHGTTAIPVVPEVITTTTTSIP